MSVNLKGRKSAKSEQAEAPAPQELVMAGAQTPWATELPAGGAVSNPFAEQGLPPGMPTLPPPPPPFAPGEEEAEADADAKKSPFSKQVIAAIVAVVVLGGGGYFYLNSGSSSSSTPATTGHTLTPAQLAALRAKAAAGAKAGTTGAAAAKPAAGAAAKPAAGAAAAKPAGAAAAGGAAGGAAKPPVTPAKAGTPAKAAAPAAPAKATTPVKAGTTVTSTQTSPTVAYTAALPGAINGWDKLAGQELPNTLAKYDSDLGASASNMQYGVFGGTSDEPYLVVETGDHSANATGKALPILRSVIKDFQAEDATASVRLSYADPVAVPHTPWGGTAACTLITGGDVSQVLCTWIDKNTFGVVLAPHRVMSQALGLLNVTRASVEH
ncbi:hypothetical protein acdb102_13110 [Acidothermaceae bacterium B102]|nr:hypothetical protein acdb102_13110 [Acidothermaceae bacterium B102]